LEPLPRPGRRNRHVPGITIARIDAAELPVTHQTRRQGRLYTLVLNKAEALSAREQEARIRDRTDLEWLAAQWNLRA
jgi:hypothetical protein